MVGGDHAAGGGGYSGGCGQPIIEEAKNGYSCKQPSDYGTGGSYFDSGVIVNPDIRVKVSFATAGGQGSKSGGFSTQGGSGGIAGKGGIIKASQNSTIFAFNGNKYSDGTNYDEGKNQLEIFAQKGILRDIYRYSMHFDNRKYKYNGKEYGYKELYKMIFGSTVSRDIDTFVENNTDPEDNYLVRPATTCGLSGYSNPITSNTQGIGSGAGYIELDNGTYTIDSNLN